MIRRYIVLCLLACLLPVLTFTILHLKHSSRNLSYEMSGPIDIAQAERFKKFILGTKKGDKVTIHIESQGGLVVSMNKMLYYLQRSQADVTCYVDSHAASAAANILMSCKKVYATPKSLILFHMIQVCKTQLMGACIEYGPVNPKDNPKAYKESLEMLKHVFPYLTKDEIQAIISGKDITLSGSELMNRLRSIK